jgi:CheY-like chemotaxis protein
MAVVPCSGCLSGAISVAPRARQQAGREQHEHYESHRGRRRFICREPAALGRRASHELPHGRRLTETLHRHSSLPGTLSVLQRATYIYQLRSCTCAHPSEAAVQNINGLSILIVEDESLLALALLDALIQAGCKIIEPVGQLDVALDVVRISRIDAAILDVSLHGEKSYPVMDTLAELGTPFVIYTGYPLSLLPCRFSDRPALNKPTDSATIIEVLARAIANADSQIPSQKCR